MEVVSEVKTYPRTVEWFISHLFNRVDDRQIAKTLLTNLPMPLHGQEKFIRQVVLKPTMDFRWYRVKKKLFQMKILKKGTRYINGRKWVCIVMNEKFIEVLDSLKRTWIVFGNFGITQEEKLDQSLFSD